MANELASRLAAMLGEQSKAELLELLRAIEEGQATAQDVDAWAGEHHLEVRRAIRDRLPPISVIRSAFDSHGELTRAGWHPRVAIGPTTVEIDADPVVIDVGDTEVVIGVLPPAGAGVVLAVGPLGGGGYLAIAPNSALAGAIGLRIGPVEVAGFARISDVQGEPSIAVVLGARLFPPVQLSFGFALSAVGGIAGVNTRVDREAISRRLQDGTALDVLFPTNPSRDGPTLLDALDEILRPEVGSHVAGPTVTITWLDLGNLGAVAQLDLALLFQLPDAKVVIAGRGRLTLPLVLAFRLDVVGEVDPGRGVVAVDAALVDSRALGIFRVTGTGALRMGWGDPPYVVATLGGFYPGFWPEPAMLPPQQRLALALDFPSPLAFHAGGYLAITSNSIQAGLDIDVGIDLPVIEAHGFVRFDAIAQFDPFHIHVDYASGFRVSIGPFEGGTTVRGWIDGPGPWTLHARVSVDLLLDDISWSDTFSIGPHREQPGPAPIESLAQHLGGALGNPSLLEAVDAVDRDVMVRPRPSVRTDVRTVASPLGRLRWTQSIVPLRTAIVKVGGRRLAEPHAVTVDLVQPTADGLTGVDEWFAPGQFLDLTAAESMSVPAFERMPAGFALVLSEDESGHWAHASLDFEQFLRPPADGVPWSWKASQAYIRGYRLEHDERLFDMAQATGAAPVVENRAPLVTLRDEPFVVTTNGVTEPATSAADALVKARHGGIAHSEWEDPLPVGTI